MFLQRLNGNWERAVYRVGNDEHICIRAGFRDSYHKVLDYAGVHFKEICEVVRPCSSMILVFSYHRESFRAFVQYLNKISANSREDRAGDFLPAGITTISAPASDFFKPSLSGRNPVTFEGVSMWSRSTATPGAWTMSYRDSSVTKGLCLWLSLVSTC